MSTVTITADTLKSRIEQNDIVLVDFWAAWCRPQPGALPARDLENLIGQIRAIDPAELSAAKARA